MAGIGFSGNDWLGIGAGISAQRVEGCGVRPLMGKRQDAYDECVKRTLDIKTMEARTADKSIPTSEPTPNRNYIIGGAIVLLILILLFRNKK